MATTSSPSIWYRTVLGAYVFAADRDGRVVELSAETGKELWETKTDTPISAGPGAGEGLVLVGTSDAEVLALGIDDGSIVWRARVTSEVLAVPRVDLGVVVIQTADGAITGLSSNDGQQLWVSDHSVPVLTLRGTSSPAVERGAVVAGFANGKVAALTTANGFQIWETSIAIPQGRSELERLVDVDANPIIVGDTVYVVSFQGKIAIIDLRSGNLGWTREMSSLCRPGGGLLPGLRHRRGQQGLGRCRVIMAPRSGNRRSCTIAP